jgi:hypothetical protein
MIKNYWIRTLGFWIMVIGLCSTIGVNHCKWNSTLTKQTCTFSWGALVFCIVSTSVGYILFDPNLESRDTSFYCIKYRNKDTGETGRIYQILTKNSADRLVKEWNADPNSKLYYWVEFIP